MSKNKIDSECFVGVCYGMFMFHFARRIFKNPRRLGEDERIESIQLPGNCRHGEKDEGRGPTDLSGMSIALGDRTAGTICKTNKNVVFV